VADEKPYKPFGDTKTSLTQDDLDALAPRSPDRLKATLQAQGESPDSRAHELMAESPGWSFVMKNEDFHFEYPKKMIRSEDVSPRTDVSQSRADSQPPPTSSFFRRPSETEDKPRRHLLSFGKKKSKATLSDSPGRKGRESPVPLPAYRPMMPSPKRFPPLAAMNRPSREQARPVDRETEEAEEEEAKRYVIHTEPLSPRKAKLPPTPPKGHTRNGSTSAAQVPLPPSPASKDDRQQFTRRERRGEASDRESSEEERDHPSPLDRYFAPSPAKAIFDRHSPSKRGFHHIHSHLAVSDSSSQTQSRNESSLSHRAGTGAGTDTLPSRQGLRDMLLASMDLLLEDHFISFESTHQAQIRRISHLERSTQDSGLALAQSQQDYAALETTLLEDRARIDSLNADLVQERSTRQNQANDATTLISQLENQLSGTKKTVSSLENRVGGLTQSLKDSQGEIDRLEKELARGKGEMNGRLGSVGRLEKEVGDWKRRAEEADFTVKALREEGVRMSRELEKRGKVIEELEKGRKFVTRV
jgi:hypothetical protein